MAQSFIAEVTVNHLDLPLLPTLRAVSGTEVQLEAQPSRRESPTLFYSVRGSDFQRFEAALTDDHTVEEWWVAMELADSRIYQIAPSEEAKFTTPKIADLGIRLLSLRSGDRGWRFQLQAPDKEALGAYWQYCREEDVEFHLEKLYTSGPETTTGDRDSLRSRLTDRQLEVARAAVRMEYFDPDGASAGEVAEELGISPSTLSTHFRRIMAKVFEYLIETE